MTLDSLLSHNGPHSKFNMKITCLESEREERNEAKCQLAD